MTTEMSEYPNAPTAAVSTTQDSMSATTRQRSLMPLIAALIIVADQLSKYLIEAALPLYRSWAPWPELVAYFRISHVSNTGAAFGLFPNGDAIFTGAAVLVSLGLIAYNFTLPDGQNGVRLALGLQLGGALGNLIDRLRLGHVTDFLDFGPWPIFNLADMAIVAGALILAWLVWQESKKLAITANSEGDAK